MNQQLLRNPTDDEIEEAFFQLGGTKSPEPECFLDLFYQRFWDVVGTDMTHAIRHFLVNSIFGPSFYSTNIVLILKIPNLSNTSQFRPISLGNFVYKVLSKTWVNRLQAILPHLITPFQSAFVTSRLIHNNIHVAHEVFHHLRTTTRANKEECAVKIDMNKAYDRIYNGASW